MEALGCRMIAAARSPQCSPPRVLIANGRCRLRITASASRGEKGFERMAEEARRRARTVAERAQNIFNDVKSRAYEFQEDSELQEKVGSFARAANQRIEEMGYEVKRNAHNLNRKYKFTQMGRDFLDYVRDQIHAADSRFRIRQRARSLTIDFRMKWPTYRRQLLSFLDTPLGKLMATVLFLWFVLSGWIFRAFVLSMWLLPVAAPLLIGTIARNTIIEGVCPSCKTQFIGSRGQVVVCRNCRNVVWQPRDDFSSTSANDPTIIDIDVDKD